MAPADQTDLPGCIAAPRQRGGHGQVHAGHGAAGRQVGGAHSLAGPVADCCCMPDCSCCQPALLAERVPPHARPCSAWLGARSAAQASMLRCSARLPPSPCPQHHTPCPPAGPRTWRSHLCTTTTPCSAALRRQRATWPPSTRTPRCAELTPPPLHTHTHCPPWPQHCPRPVFAAAVCTACWRMLAPA
jgi:hypothetical protein